jgi:hypothetical protein
MNPKVSAALVGGFFGTWVGAGDLGLAFSRAGLSAAGASPGAGVVIVLSEGACGLLETARIMAWYARQGAGQCGPCVFGLPALAAEMAALSHGRLPAGGLARGLPPRRRGPPRGPALPRQLRGGGRRRARRWATTARREVDIGGTFFATHVAVSATSHAKNSDPRSQVRAVPSATRGSPPGNSGPATAVESSPARQLRGLPEAAAR